MLKSLCTVELLSVHYLHRDCWGLFLSVQKPDKGRTQEEPDRQDLPCIK